MNNKELWNIILSETDIEINENIHTTSTSIVTVGSYPYLSTDNVNWTDGCYFTGVSNLQRSPANNAPTCGAISATSALFYGLSANKTYYFKVKAQDSIQSSTILFSSTSDTKSITTGV